MMIKNSLVLILVLVMFSANLFGQERPQGKPEYRLYLIGDAGSPGGNPTLSLLKERLQAEGAGSGIIFLGDNIYNNGLPPEGDKSRDVAESIINSQIDIVKDFDGDIFFIPGNHDWDSGKKNGLRNILEQEKYVENALDSVDVFLPSNGCPGPIEIALSDRITLVILDTQYFLQKGEKPGIASSCGAKSGEEAFLELHDILIRNTKKKVIVASHHPIYTKGMHGGVVTAKDHLFPLTKASPNLWIPLPIIGSIFPVFRQTIGGTQDQANIQHKSMVNTINALLVTHENLVHVSGHEHALQYLAQDNVNYIVSGAGSKQNTTVKLKRPSKFAGNYHGYGYVDYYANGEVWLSFESPDTEDPIVFEQRISDNPFEQELLVEDLTTVSLPNSPQTMNATDVLEGKKSKAFFFGEGYRKEWFQGVEAPVFDIGTEKGGLIILKKGGGNQTKSLRLEAKDGKQYVLRLLEKDASKLIPEQFRSNFVKKVVQEGISGSNPYASFVVPPIAEAVGVYHTNPKLVFIPDDPRLGIYREDFKNKLSLFEERAAKDQSDAPYFGNAKKVINTPDMIANLYKDNDNSVDQKAVLRARLLDTFLGDWDRHDDQWRWAQIRDKKGKDKLYRPIPRDRDQVFYRKEGLVPNVIGSSWAVPALQGFGPDVKDVAGLWTYAVKYFDRSFLTEMERKDWVNAAEKMQAQLTDELLDSSLKLWPDEIYQYHAEEILADLKSRRDNLDKYAIEYYETLAKTVDVVGSNKREHFIVTRVNKDTTLVKVFKISHKGKESKLLYKRRFITSETKEISLYGLDGDDIFEVEGTVSRGPKIRVIGGAGKDDFSDNSRVGKIGNSWLVYDTKTNNTINKGRETSNKTSNQPGVNIYNRKAFEYNKMTPLVALNFNRDDGVFIGGGFNYKVYGFRKEPFKSSHKFGGAVSVATGAFSIAYEGEYTDVLGKVDFLLTAVISAPNFVTNFFGIGNESVYDQSREIDYYRVRFEQTHLNALLKFNAGENVTFRVGSSSQMVEVENTPNTFLGKYSENGLDSASIYERKTWTGVASAIDIDTRDKTVLTSRGIQWLTTFNYYAGLTGGANEYGKFTSAFTFYYSFKQPSRVTLSNRIGYGHTFGSPEFHQLMYLDGHDQLRGFRKYRFAGEQAVYNNTDLTIKLAKIRAFILPTQIGINLFYDVGRVFVANEDSNIVHQSYGFGLWVAPANALYLSLLYGRSDEGWYPQMKIAFGL